MPLGKKGLSCLRPSKHGGNIWDRQFCLPDLRKVNMCQHFWHIKCFFFNSAIVDLSCDVSVWLSVHDVRFYRWHCGLPLPFTFLWASLMLLVGLLIHGHAGDLPLEFIVYTIHTSPILVPQNGWYMFDTSSHRNPSVQASAPLSVRLLDATCWEKVHVFPQRSR